ncbi:hypothetical protein OIU84_023144 [Salix udensis]|uniref:Uncharacterized protein n=1 Tax=Salix udensis TaxID=889485 RepID=A0AAD6PG01_9ROSI|nr:hypothetical protein OIU84_023144 [Salix udensis]
MNVFLRLFSS